MGKLWVITAREYVERVRTRWFLFSTIFGPVFFAALMILPAIITRRTKASEEASRIVVLDVTGRELGRRVADGLSVGMLSDTARARVRELAPHELGARGERCDARDRARRAHGLSGPRFRGARTGSACGTPGATRRRKRTWTCCGGSCARA